MIDSCLSGANKDVAIGITYLSIRSMEAKQDYALLLCRNAIAVNEDGELWRN